MVGKYWSLTDWSGEHFQKGQSETSGDSLYLLKDITDLEKKKCCGCSDYHFHGTYILWNENCWILPDCYFPGRVPQIHHLRCGQYKSTNRTFHSWKHQKIPTTYPPISTPHTPTHAPLSIHPLLPINNNTFPKHTTTILTPLLRFIPRSRASDLFPNNIMPGIPLLEFAKRDLNQLMSLRTAIENKDRLANGVAPALRQEVNPDPVVECTCRQSMFGWVRKRVSGMKNWIAGRVNEWVARTQGEKKRLT